MSQLVKYVEWPESSGHSAAAAESVLSDIALVAVRRRPPSSPTLDCMEGVEHATHDQIRLVVRARAGQESAVDVAKAAQGVFESGTGATVLASAVGCLIGPTGSDHKLPCPPRGKVPTDHAIDLVDGMIRTLALTLC